MVPELRDPGYERLGPIGYVVKAGRRETIRRIQNLKVSLSKCQLTAFPILQFRWRRRTFGSWLILVREQPGLKRWSVFFASASIIWHFIFPHRSGRFSMIWTLRAGARSTLTRSSSSLTWTGWAPRAWLKTSPPVRALWVAKQCCETKFNFFSIILVFLEIWKITSKGKAR